MTDTRALWTIAYRKPTANRFQRVTDWCGTWDEARDMGDRFAQLHPKLQVYYVPTAESEANGYRAAEDIGTVLNEKTGKRIKIVDTGTLPEELRPVETQPEASEPVNESARKWVSKLSLLTHAEQSALLNTPLGVTCTGCGDFLETEYDFARHFAIPDARYRNIGECPRKTMGPFAAALFLGEYSELTVCQCCFLCHHNGECCDGTAHEGYEPLSEISRGDLVSGPVEHSDGCTVETRAEDGCECDQLGFMARGCDGCGSPYHGDKYAMTLVYVREETTPDVDQAETHPVPVRRVDRARERRVRTALNRRTRRARKG